MDYSLNQDTVNQLTAQIHGISTELTVDRQKNFYCTSAEALELVQDAIVAAVRQALAENNRDHEANFRVRLQQEIDTFQNAHGWPLQRVLDAQKLSINEIRGTILSDAACNTLGGYIDEMHQQECTVCHRKGHSSGMCWFNG